MLPSFRLLPTATATAILVALAGCVSTPHRQQNRQRRLTRRHS